MTTTDIRHEEVSPESPPPSTDKRKRFQSLEGSPQSTTPPLKEKLKLFQDEEGSGSGSGKSSIEVSGSESSVSSHVVPGLGSSSSGSYKSTIELPDFGPSNKVSFDKKSNKVSRLGSSSSGSDKSTIELPDFGSINEVSEFGPIKSSIEVSDIYDDSDEDDREPDVYYDYSDEYDYRPCGSKADYQVDWKVWKKYHKQIKDSEGFEIDDYPGDCPAAHWTPLVDFKEKKRKYSILKHLGELAIQHFNENNNKEFSLVDIERAVGMASAGILYYITIVAKDPHEADALKVLRGKVLDGIEEPEVHFCKLKPATN